MKITKTMPEDRGVEALTGDAAAFGAIALQFSHISKLISGDQLNSLPEFEEEYKNSEKEKPRHKGESRLS